MKILLILLFSLSLHARVGIELRESFNISAEKLMPYFTDAKKIGWLGPFNHFEKSPKGKFSYGEGSTRSVVIFGQKVITEKVLSYDYPYELTYSVQNSRIYKSHLAKMKIHTLGPKRSLLVWSIQMDNEGRMLPWFTEKYLKSAMRRLVRRVSRDN